MSYDIDLDAPAAGPCPTCGHHADTEPVECPSPTYNLTAIFDLALTGAPYPNADVAEGAVVLLGAKTDRPRGLRLLSGRKAEETRLDIQRALQRLLDPAMEAQFIALEPPNKWGTHRDAIAVMQRLHDLTMTHPAHVWSIR